MDYLLKEKLFLLTVISASSWTRFSYPSEEGSTSSDMLEQTFVTRCKNCKTTIVTVTVLHCCWFWDRWYQLMQPKLRQIFHSHNVRVGRVLTDCWCLAIIKYLQNIQSDTPMRVEWRAITLQTVGGSSGSPSPMSSSTGGDAWVPECYLKKTSTEVWWDKDLVSFRISP